MEPVTIRCVRAVLSVVLGCGVLATGCGSDSSGFTPEERAAQLATRYENTICEQGDSHCPKDHNAHAEIKCVFEADNGGEDSGSAWYTCTPGPYYVACSKSVTEAPLSGPIERNMWQWGDCVLD